MSQHDDGFDDVINAGYQSGQYQQPAHVDPSPYGIPANSIPVKPGLTKRGKVALAIGAAVLATTGSLFWVHHTDTASANANRAQELQIQKAQIDLEMQREMNKAAAANSKTQTSADTARQKKVDACVNANKDLVGKQLGATYRSVLEDCQAQYQATSSSGDMENAASAQDTGTGSGGGANEGLLIAGGVLVGGIFLVARKARNANPA